MPTVLHLILEDLRTYRGNLSALTGTLQVLLFDTTFRPVCGYRIAHALWNRKHRWLAMLITRNCKVASGVEISPDAHIGRRFRLVHGYGTVIGGGSRVGDDCMIYQGVTLGTGNARFGDTAYPTIGNAVTIYAGAKVVGQVMVGENAVIGANAVVTRDIPPNSVAVGIPARVVRSNTPEATAPVPEATTAPLM